MDLRNQSGFNLLELMLGITLLGIVLGIGVPSFNETIRNNRVTAEANNLIGALSFARSEATKRGMPVSLCVAADDNLNSCAAAGAGDWSAQGWIAFSDRTGAAGVINPAIPANAGDEIIQTFPRPSDAVTLGTGAVSFVRYGATGARINPNVDVVFGVQSDYCSGTQRRTLTIGATGRAILSKVACL